MSLSALIKTLWDVNNKCPENLYNQKVSAVSVLYNFLPLTKEAKETWGTNGPQKGMWWQTKKTKKTCII